MTRDKKLARSLTLRRSEAYLKNNQYDKASADANEIIGELESDLTIHALDKQEKKDLARAYYLRSRINKIRGTGDWFNDAAMISSAGADLRKAQELDPETYPK